MMFYCPLTCNSASDWKVPTTFIYGQQDWMNYQGAQQARKDMKVPCEIIRVPQVNLSLAMLHSRKLQFYSTWFKD